MPTLNTWRNLGRLGGVVLLALFLACVSSGHRHALSGSLQVFNDGSVTMTQLYVTPSGSTTWGVDQLNPDYLLPTESLVLTGLYPETYDVQAIFSDMSRDEVFDVPINDGVLTVLGLADSGNGTVAVVNGSGLTINGIYLTLTTSSTWGPNQADLPLDPGQTLNLTGVSPGAYDLEVVFAGGTTARPASFTVGAGLTTTIQVP